MTTTHNAPAAAPRTRAEAEKLASAEASRRLVLEEFPSTDGTADPATGKLRTIMFWGVFDVDRRGDGRNGMVWLSPQGFLAHDDPIAAQSLLDQAQAAFVTELMAEWDRLHPHTVIRLDGQIPHTPEVTRLAQLTALYDDAKREADAAAERLKEITDGIKAQVWQLHPGGEDFTITSGALAHPLTLVHSRRRVFDTAAAKRVLSAEQYDALCKNNESWTLKAKK